MNDPKKDVKEILRKNKDAIEKEVVRILEENGVDIEEAKNAYELCFVCVPCSS